MRHSESGDLLLLGLLNFIVFQWFFIRVNYDWNTENRNRIIGYSYWVVPLTGWWPFGYMKTFYFGRKKYTPVFGGAIEIEIFSYKGK